jgi:putative nucleotidyltransferase with HDIG domain
MAMPLDINAASTLFPEISAIEGAALRRDVADIWCEIAGEMAWDDLTEVPQSLKTPRPLIEHVRSVTCIALAIADGAKTSLNRSFDRDLLLAACLLHDASKPVETEPATPDDRGASPRQVRLSKLGAHLQHGVYAAHKVLARKMPIELAHLIVTHTHASNNRGKSWEAAILFYADYAATDAVLSTLHREMYLERWRL